MRNRVLVPLLFLALACASGNDDARVAGRPETMPQPLVEIDQPGAIFFGSGFEAPVSLNVQVMNRGKEPLRVREIEVTSPGMGQYSIYPHRRFYNETIAPGEAKTFMLAPTAYTEIRRLTPTEPLTLRTIVHFESGEARFREVYFTRGLGLQ